MPTMSLFMICILSLVDHIYSLKPNPDMPSTSQQPDAFLLYQAKKALGWRDKRKVRSLLCNITWCCVFQNCFVCSRHHQNGSSLNDIPFTRKWLGFVTFFNSYLMAVLKTRLRSTYFFSKGSNSQLKLLFAVPNDCISRSHTHFINVLSSVSTKQGIFVISSKQVEMVNWQNKYTFY